MITGFNTDVTYDGHVFHVQTEDRGVDNPLIETLVYLGGRVVASRQVSYSDLVYQGEATQAIAERLQDHHQRAIDALEGGDLDEEVAGLLAAEAEEAPMGEAFAAAGEKVALDVVLQDAFSDSVAEDTAAYSEVAEPEGAAPEEAAVPQAVATLEEPDQLEIELDTNGNLKPRDRVALAIQSLSGLSGEPIGHARIKVTLISTATTPRTLGTGVTGDDGKLRMTLWLPDYRAGTAALIVAAESRIGSTEIQHLL